MNYQVSRNSLGVVDAINRRSDGATVPYWDQADLLTIELREWESINGVLDLSDRLVEPQIQTENYMGFLNGLLSEGHELFLSVRTLADSNLPLSNCYTDLQGAIGFGQSLTLQSAISNLFAAMAAAGQPFTTAQSAQIRTLLDANGFKLIFIPA